MKSCGTFSVSFAADIAAGLLPGYASGHNRIRMLSQRAKYALRAMIRLADSPGDAPVSVAALARDTQIPRAFLEQIFSELRRRNLVVSRRGKQGGFVLARDPRTSHSRKSSAMSTARWRWRRARAVRHSGLVRNARASRPASCDRH